jgi:hypothetical protein
MKQLVSVVITDLDNTLFDWVEVWYQCFSAMLDSLIAISGVQRETLLSEIKQVHERHGTAEYAFLVEELPSLAHLCPEQDRAVVYSAAIDAYRDARRKYLMTYPGVTDTLKTLNDAGVLIIGYTESMSFYTNYRVRRLGLDGLTDIPPIAGLLRAIFRPVEARCNEIRWRLAVPEAKSPDWLAQRARTHRLAFIRAHLDPHPLPHLLPLIPHAGAGGARRRMISDRISANICRGTATSAIWKVT